MAYRLAVVRCSGVCCPDEDSASGDHEPVGVLMRQPNPDHAGPLRVGSLFSGYGGLDLAVEDVFNATTVWFSEINEPVARIFCSPLAPRR